MMTILGKQRGILGSLVVSTCFSVVSVLSVSLW